MESENKNLEYIGEKLGHDRSTILNYIREGSKVFDWFKCDEKLLIVKCRKYKIITKYNGIERIYNSFQEL